MILKYDVTTYSCHLISKMKLFSFLTAFCSIPITVRNSPNKALQHKLYFALKVVKQESTSPPFPWHMFTVHLAHSLYFSILHEVETRLLLVDIQAHLSWLDSQRRVSLTGESNTPFLWPFQREGLRVARGSSLLPRLLPLASSWRIWPA